MPARSFGYAYYVPIDISDILMVDATGLRSAIPCSGDVTHIVGFSTDMYSVGYLRTNVRELHNHGRPRTHPILEGKVGNYFCLGRRRYQIFYCHRLSRGHNCVIRYNESRVVPLNDLTIDIQSCRCALIRDACGSGAALSALVWDPSV